MSFFFLFNNLHFSLEILGALAFLIVAWLAFDAFGVRRDFSSASRGVGFCLLAAGQAFHAFGFSSDFYIYFGFVAYLAGIIFVALNLLMESMGAERPQFKAILVLPAAFALLRPMNAILAIGFFLIAFLSFRQYRKEFKKILLPFWLGFAFLTFEALSSIFYNFQTFDALWLIGHGLKLTGFFALGWWVWNHLQLRIREEIFLIFISFALLMAIVVSLTFSTILINNMEIQTKSGLLTDAKVLDFAISSFKEKALAKAKFLASDSDIKEAIVGRSFLKLEELAGEFLEKEKLGFLILLDEQGNVLLRAHSLSKREDNLTGERAVAAALKGESFVTIESSPVEKFSIRAASPLIRDGKTVGVIVAGFPLDNAFTDNVKKITGLEMSIFEGDTRVATTAFNPDGRTRSVGVKLFDERVSRTVLQEGKDITLRAAILSKPFLASYLPLRGDDDQIVGMISAAKAQREILEMANATNRLTLVTVIVIMLILIIPIYLITRRLSAEIV